MPEKNKCSFEQNPTSRKLIIANKWIRRNTTRSAIEEERLKESAGRKKKDTQCIENDGVRSLKTSSYECKRSLPFSSFNVSPPPKKKNESIYGNTLANCIDGRSKPKFRLISLLLPCRFATLWFRKSIDDTSVLTNARLFAAVLSAYQILEN